MTVEEIENLMVKHMPKFAAIENKAMRASYADEKACAYCGDEFRSAGRGQKYCGAECAQDANRERSRTKAA